MGCHDVRRRILCRFKILEAVFKNRPKHYRYQTYSATHQGRAAEAILAQTLVKKGDVIPNNSHFDTTRANIEYVGGIADNLLCKEGLDTSDESPFKGNMDIELLKQCIVEHGRGQIPFAMSTVS